MLQSFLRGGSSNAAVEARNVETGVVYKTTSTDTGNYTIAQLPVGSYQVSIAVSRCKKWRDRGVLQRLPHPAPSV